MSLKLRQTILLIPPWIAAILLLGRFVFRLDHLPARLAVHFDAGGNPNGWMARGTFAGFMAGMLMIELAVFSWAVRRLDRPMAGGALIGLFYLFLTGEIGLFWRLIDTNVTGAAVDWTWIAVASLIAAAVPPVAVYLASRTGRSAHPRDERRPSPTDGQEIGLEIHRSRLRFWLNAPFCLGLVVGWMAAPGPVWKGIVAVLAVVTGYFMGLIWSGFRYRALRSGLEVRGPWGRLAFVPSTEILGYEVRFVSPLRQFGGWGIRGGGASRAFIWGGERAVRIETTRGEIWLGHEQPERLADLLERILKARR